MADEKKEAKLVEVKVHSPEREGSFKGKGYYSAQQHWPVGVHVRKVTEKQLADLRADHEIGRLSLVAVGAEEVAKSVDAKGAAEALADKAAELDAREAALKAAEAELLQKQTEPPKGAKPPSDKK